MLDENDVCDNAAVNKLGDNDVIYDVCYDAQLFAVDDTEEEDDGVDGKEVCPCGNIENSDDAMSACNGGMIDLWIMNLTAMMSSFVPSVDGQMSMHELLLV